MSKDRQIFRQASIDRLSSPEQLDEVMAVTTSRGWLSLAAIWLLLVVAVIWAFVGRLPTTVSGVGILIRTGGLADVATTASGQIVRIHLDRGDHVKEGDVVAQIDQPQLVEEVTAAKARLEELRADHEQLKSYGGEGRRLQSDFLAQSRSSHNAELRAARERRVWLKERVEARTRLYEQGLITQNSLRGTTMELQNTQDTISDLAAQLKRLRLDDLTSDKQHDSELRKSGFNIKEAERRLTFLQEQLTLSTQVISPHTGRVLELRAQAGDIVADGTALLSVELVGDEEQSLEALLYIPSSEGKQVHAGMTARVAPSIVRPEEHGMVIATITSVAEFPSTRTGMMRVLDNEELVASLLRATSGAPLAVWARLEPADEAPSGYRWTSGSGPDVRLSSGTPCDVVVTTKVQRPITLVVPALRHWLGV